MLVLAVAIAATPLVTTAQLQPRDTTISVNITRSGRAPADRVSLYFGVEGIGETPAAALDRMQVKLKAMQDSDRRVSPTTLLDVPLMLGVGPSAPNGYPTQQSPLSLARGALRVTVTKLTDLPALQAAVSLAGATMSAGVAYESSTTDAVWRTKATEALESARLTAELSASTQGYKLGRLLSMNVNTGQQVNFPQQTPLNFEARNNYTPMFAPEIVVNATVSATYLLVKK